MKSTTLLLSLLLFIFIACGENGQEQPAMTGEAEIEQETLEMGTPDEFKAELVTLLEDYFELKNALVETDAGTAAEKAAQLNQTASEISGDNLNADPQSFWFTTRELITAASENISGEEDVEEQRFHFEGLSNALIETVQTFQPAEFDIYRQRCPMVRGGDADWLSQEEEIRNPYHGDRMMNCGFIVHKFGS